jgi:hypothetical protein
MKPFALALLLLGTGCAALAPSIPIGQAVSAYRAAAPNVRLGDTRDRVIDVLAPSQARLRPDWKKEPEQFLENDVLTEVLFFRSAISSDGVTTDDEFTPYVFKEGRLVAVGWAYLGGPKTAAPRRAIRR